MNALSGGSITDDVDCRRTIIAESWGCVLKCCNQKDGSQLKELSNKLVIKIFLLNPAAAKNECSYPKMLWCCKTFQPKKSLLADDVIRSLSAFNMAFSCWSLVNQIWAMRTSILKPGKA
jgi:hypothetical protein